MDYKFLGQSGIKLSSVSFGTQTLGWNIFGEEAHRLLDIYVARGGNYLDTADSYNKGDSERILGKWLKDRSDRENLIIGTKTYFPTGKDANQTGLSRKHIYHSVDESLRRLNIDEIDIYQFHCYDGATALDEVLLTMDSLVQAGKIRYWGFSNFTPSRMMKAIILQKHFGRHRPVSLQLEYSLLVRSPEWEILPVCVEEKVGTITWSPLAGGWLTGKYLRDQAPPKDSRVGRKDRWDDQEEQRGGDRTWRIIDALQTVSKKLDVPISQVALNWLRKKPAVTTVLMGARNKSQLEDNLGCIDWKLDSEDESLLDRASEVAFPSPYNFIQKYSREIENDFN